MVARYGDCCRTVDGDEKAETIQQLVEGEDNVSEKATDAVATIVAVAFTAFRQNLVRDRQPNFFMVDLMFTVMLL